MISFSLLRLPLPLAAGIFAGLTAPAARACGPDFPNAYLASSGPTLAALPTLSFPAELARAFPSERPPFAYAASGQHDAELAEIRAVLAPLLPRWKLESALAKYTRNNPPAELPAEFQLYAAGTRAWRNEQLPRADAVAAWRQLLALPAAERPHRTVWAHYMIGRALWDTDEAAARESFQAARRAAAEKFTDVEGLAAASLGWEARTYFARGDIAAALPLYLQQQQAGDPGAVVSLRFVLQKLFSEEEPLPNADAVLRQVAARRDLRTIVTAWFTSRGGPHMPWSARAATQFRRWLSALPKDATLEPAEADRWSWAAYQNGLWDEAQKFADAAPADAPASEWVRAMLLLRAGDLEQAVTHLAAAAQAFPRDAALESPLFLADDSRFEWTHEDPPRSQLSGVRGVLALRREQYAEALRLFVGADHWADAAYVAEQVLTLDELTAFVRDELPGVAGASGTPTHAPAALRDLLARRLVRAGRFDAAREYFPQEIRPTFERYVAFVRDGYREENPRQLRALALWQAAQIVRQSGMELQGTELEPDYTIWGGSFQWPDTSTVRLTNQAAETAWRPNPPSDSLAEFLTASPNEQQRTQAQRLPTRRFHYRQRAAELAFLAATLLPDNDDLTATILNTAGRWIAPRYPDDAQLFYKTLVFRCPRTVLGKAAAERHWFVPRAETGAPASAGL